MHTFRIFSDLKGPGKRGSNKDADAKGNTRFRYCGSNDLAPSFIKRRDRPMPQVF